MEDNPRPEGEPALRTIAMPADTNPNGDIFGGWLLSQMDLAASNAAVQRARAHIDDVLAGDVDRSDESDPPLRHTMQELTDDDLDDEQDPIQEERVDLEDERSNE